MARRFYGSDQVSTALAWARGLGQHGPGDGLRQFGQDRLQAADHGLEQADAGSESTVYVGLDGAVVVQVDDTDGGVGLADTVDATDALLDPHRVPRHVVVDHRAAELEVQSLGGGVGAQQDVGLTVAETTLGFVSTNDAPGTVRGRDLPAASRETHQAPAPTGAQLVTQEVHRVGVLGEHHHLAVAVAVQLGKGLAQALALAVRRQHPDAGEEMLDI